MTRVFWEGWGGEVKRGKGGAFTRRRAPGEQRGASEMEMVRERKGGRPYGGSRERESGEPRDVAEDDEEHLRNKPWTWGTRREREREERETTVKR